MKTGIELIAQEREEQIHKHNRTIEKDVTENPNGELTDGASALINNDFEQFPQQWDYEICDKMMNKSYMNRLIIAGALIAAEIDRIQTKQ